MKKKLIYVFLIVILVLALAGLASAVYLSGKIDNLAGQKTLKPLNERIDVSSAPGGIHIISWNTGFLYKGKNWQREAESGSVVAAQTSSDPRRITAFLNKQLPDILLLQEALQSDVKIIDSSLNKYESYFGSGTSPSRLEYYLNRSKSNRGMALLSRLKPLETTVNYLSDIVSANDSFHYFFQIINFRSAADDKNWVIVNAGLNQPVSSDNKKAFKTALLKLLDSQTAGQLLKKEASVVCADLSSLNEAEFKQLVLAIPAGWKIYRGENAPDSRDRTGIYSRLETASWNRVAFIISDSVNLDKIFVHDLKFADTPGNPVSAILSLK